MYGSRLVVLLLAAGCSLRGGSPISHGGSDPSDPASGGGGGIGGHRPDYTDTDPGAGLQARTFSVTWHGSAQLPGLHGLVMQPGGNEASVGVHGNTCTVSTLTGNFDDDNDYLPDDDDPQDGDGDGDDGGGGTDTGWTWGGTGWTSGTWGDTGGYGGYYGSYGGYGGGYAVTPGADQRLLILSHTGSKVAVRHASGLVEQWNVPYASQAAFVNGGILVYSESPTGCRLSRIGDDGAVTPHDLPVDACGSHLAVDRVHGVAWLANGDLWSVARDGTAALVAENAGDLVTFEPTMGAPVTAFHGGREISMLGHWTAQTDYEIRSLANLEGVGAVMALTTGAVHGSNHLLGFEAGWGGAMGDQPAPAIDATLAVDRNGGSIGLIMNEQAVFFDLTVE